MVFDAKCKSKASLNGKTAVITGCNTGIGKEIAKDFYKRGGRVVMACRNLGKAEKAAADIEKECESDENLGQIVLIELNLASLKSIKKCAQKVLEKEEKINILVNNAGVMMCPKCRTDDGFELQFGVNHLGHFLLTMLLLPRMIKSRPARVVNVSSVAHLVSNSLNFEDINWDSRDYSPLQAYCQSKLANILFTKELARRLEEAKIDGITTYSVHPGVVSTELSRYVEYSYSTATNWLIQNIFTLFGKTPEEGAQTVIHCSVDENIANQSGLYYAECEPAEPTSKAENVEDAKALWEVSLKMTGLPEHYSPFINIK